MKVLVTGANGFIGQALCKRMLADGYQVRGAKSREQRAESREGRAALPSGVEGVLVGDIGPETDWSEALDGIEGIVHLAARVHVMHESAADPLAAFREVNVEGTKCLAIAAANAGVKRLVYISTVKVNGERTRYSGQWSVVSGQGKNGDQWSVVSGQEKTEVTPVEFPWGSPIQLGKEVRGEGELKEFFSEKDIPEPRDPYGISKLEAEQVLRDVAADTGMEVVVLRPPIVYGPWVKGNFLRLLKLINKGIPLPLASIKNRRSLIYIGNLVDAIVNCMTNPNAAGKTYLVSDGDDVSTPELIRRIAYSMGRPPRLYFFPTKFIQLAARLSGKSAIVDRLVSSLSVNISKIKHDLNWNPPYTMDEGIRETVCWYKSAE
ncbi:MAG: SDR family oxidoreductase [Desulfobacteraceae bacterium]|nr:SDR family oxidoreductase [Desulfobacteraceae bacterium]